MKLKIDLINRVWGKIRWW